ncbi:MAG: EutN/CcmL family microcompartment protein [Clostridia bacterium]|nr:EutN/CcmL family microcompartment protein [Clostridia bacterium]
MYTAKVIGHVVATQKDPNLSGTKLLVVVQVDSTGRPIGKPHVAVDTIGAGADEFVTIVRGREAGMPLPAPMAPVDAAAVGIIDTMSRVVRNV